MKMSEYFVVSHTHTNTHTFVLGLLMSNVSFKCFYQPDLFIQIEPKLTIDSHMIYFLEVKIKD